MLLAIPAPHGPQHSRVRLTGPRDGPHAQISLERPWLARSDWRQEH